MYYITKSKELVMARYKRGSTPKLTPSLIEEISAAISAGATVETAILSAGISKDSFYRWLRGATGLYSTAPMRDLLRAVRSAANIDSADRSEILKDVNEAPHVDRGYETPGSRF
jgi:hypothetical protein